MDLFPEIVNDLEKRFHVPEVISDVEKADHSAVGALVKDTATELLKLTPAGRYASLVLTSLEEAAAWAHKGIQDGYEEAAKVGPGVLADAQQVGQDAESALTDVQTEAATLAADVDPPAAAPTVTTEPDPAPEVATPTS